MNSCEIFVQIIIMIESMKRYSLDEIAVKCWRWSREHLDLYWFYWENSTKRISTHLPRFSNTNSWANAIDFALNIFAIKLDSDYKRGVQRPFSTFINPCDFLYFVVIYVHIMRSSVSQFITQSHLIISHIIHHIQCATKPSNRPSIPFL